MKVRGSDLRVGRILHEDADLMTIEVAKSDQRRLSLENGDRFLTILFVKHSPSAVDQARMVAWLPWEDR